MCKPEWEDVTLADGTPIVAPASQTYTWSDIRAAIVEERQIWPAGLERIRERLETGSVAAEGEVEHG